MGDMVWNKGDRVVITHKRADSTAGPGETIVRSGVVEKSQRGWVMVELDEPAKTSAGWESGRMLVRDSELSLQG